MIKKFEEFIRESIWSDVQDRSSGDVVRKEDDIDFYDREQFFEYLNNNYEYIANQTHIKGAFDIRQYEVLNKIMIPVFLEDNKTPFRLEIAYSPKLVIVFGILMDFSVLQTLKAFAPMLVTVYSMLSFVAVSGMVNVVKFE